MSIKISLKSKFGNSIGCDRSYRRTNIKYLKTDLQADLYTYLKVRNVSQSSEIFLSFFTNRNRSIKINQNLEDIRAVLINNKMKNKTEGYEGKIL